jgi:chorismate mutase
LLICAYKIYMIEALESNGVIVSFRRLCVYYPLNPRRAQVMGERTSGGPVPPGGQVPLGGQVPPGGPVPPIEPDRCLGRALSRVRRRIDRLDRRITALLVRRRGEVVEAGRIKGLLGLPVADTRREEEIVARIRGYGRGGGADYIEEVYRAIFRCSRAVEEGERWTG